MTKRHILAALTLISVAAASKATAQNYVVVVNEAVPATSVSKSELGRIFQKQASRWENGLQVEPVDQVEATAVRTQFSLRVLERTTQQVKAYWQAQVFGGHGAPPVELPNDHQVLQFVQTHAGAVGYVVAGTRLPEGVKVLQVAGS
jgi:ABC-type phosphate transport system substrate-binding protein